MISYLSMQDFDASSRALEDAVKEYEKATAIPTDREQVARLKAEKSYESALKELKKAHAALDVKILEFFLKRAREFLEMGNRAPAGDKISNYQICRKLSEEVLEQLKDPQLRARLRKLREAGYFDPFRLT